LSVTFEDITLRDYTLDKIKGLAGMRERLLKSPVEICIERAKYMTGYMKNHPEEEKTPLLFRAASVAHYLSNKKCVFPDNNIIAGTTGSYLKSAPVYPEFIGLTIWSELDTISTRKKNPQLLSKEDAEELNLGIFPFWIERDILSATKKRFGESIHTRLLEKLIFFIAGKGGCISHTVPMLEHVLAEGIDNIIQQAKEKAGKENNKQEFYNAVIIALNGVLNYAKNLSQEAERLAEEAADQESKMRYKRMAKACINVPAKPATGYYEAVTCIWLCLVAIHAENINMAISPGRLDQVLYPYYKADIESGAITLEDALEITGNLWLKLGDNVNLVPSVSEELFGGAGTAPAVTLGGIDKNGNDAVNDLTYIMLKVTELLALREPNMNARYNYEKNEKRYRDRVAEVITSTKAVPAFHNDDTNIKTLVNQGVTLEHARDYSIIGCVELAVSGRSYDASSSIILNLSAPLEMALYNGKRYKTGNEKFGGQTGEAGDFTSYEQFWNAFKNQTAWLIEKAVKLNEQMAEIHQQIAPSPVLSAFFEGPMDNGRDLVFGGAVYNSSGATHVGFADVTDSLNAVKSLFMDKRFTMKELINAVKADFAGNEELRQYLINNTLKYGTSDETKDGVSCELVKFLYDTYQSYTNYRGGKYRPAYWSMTNHSGQGKITHALPNGRKAGQPFASGVTPVSNAAKNLTECLNRVAALACEYIPGNVALNIKFTSIENNDDVKRLGDFVEAYFINGGQQVQFNIMSREMLEKAKANPGKNPGLLVRVSGYSAYFDDLSDSMKDELITRTEYGIKDGKAVL
jgi:formate C-acetyltransferase